MTNTKYPIPNTQFPKRAIVFVICYLLFVIGYFSFVFVSPALAIPIVPPPGGGGGSDIGTINPGDNFVPTASGDPSFLAARIIKSILTLLLIVAFIIALIWNILAGLKFITANGDPKGISEAWSRIYWGIIGLVVVVGSFAIIKMVEAFFKIDIISGGLKLPTI